MSDLYLTIDDSPSGRFPELCAFLKSRGIPAVFFVRGDLLSLYPDQATAAICDGFVLANHGWSHHHASRLGVDLTLRDIDKTQKLIDALYARAGVARPGPYLRFPHMDSGLGGWPLSPETFNDAERAELLAAYGRFYNNAMMAPDDAARACHAGIEAELKKRGYRQMNFPGVTIPWYLRYAASSAVSTQGTFCHPDWWLNARHVSKFEGATDPVAILNENVDAFVAMHPTSAQILVMHDGVEVGRDFPRLIDHLIAKGHRFLPIPA